MFADFTMGDLVLIERALSLYSVHLTFLEVDNPFLNDLYTEVLKSIELLNSKALGV